MLYLTLKTVLCEFLYSLWVRWVNSFLASGSCSIRRVHLFWIWARSNLFVCSSSRLAYHYQIGSSLAHPYWPTWDIQSLTFGSAARVFAIENQSDKSNKKARLSLENWETFSMSNCDIGHQISGFCLFFTKFDSSMLSIVVQLAVIAKWSKCDQEHMGLSVLNGLTLDW